MLRDVTPIHKLIAFVRLGRPLHLVGGVLFNGLGISIAHFLGAPIDWTTAMWGQVAITSIQLMTHYSNDYFDQDADQAAVTPTRWASGSRVLPEGTLSPRVALVAALVLAGVALLATAIVTAASASPVQTMLLLLMALFLAWSYSSPPLFLNRRGWGELTGAVLVPILTTLVGFQLQTGQLALMPLLAALPLSCFQFAMLLSVNFPDAEGDAAVNKRTLVVKLGRQRAGGLFVGALFLAYGLLPLLIWLGLPPQAAGAVLLTLPIAIWQAWRIRRGAASDPSQWNALAFWSIGLLMSATLLELIAFILA